MPCLPRGEHQQQSTNLQRRSELSKEDIPKDKEKLPEYSQYKLWARELFLAFGLVALLLGSMWIATGMFPPLVVVESGSMMHESEDSSIGVIDPGDLVLVMNPERSDVVTYVEAIDPSHEDFGHKSHGMFGDVIVFRKNGDSSTPVIHRAIAKAVSNSSGGWDIPGTDIRNAETITMEIDYKCPYHGGDYNLRLVNWTPFNEGFLTSGDNRVTNGCKIDQIYATGQDSRNGLRDQFGNPVTEVKDEWVIGVASSEIPWIGAIKLGFSDSYQSVTANTWFNLTLTLLFVLASPMIVDAIPFGKSNEEEE